MIVLRIAALLVVTWISHSFVTTHGYWPHGESWGLLFGVGLGITFILTGLSPK